MSDNQKIEIFKPIFKSIKDKKKTRVLVYLKEYYN